MSDVSTLGRALCLVAAVVCGCNGQARADCFGDLRDALSRGGYTGGLDCNLVDIKVHKVGRVTVNDASFEIYDLQYKTISKEQLPAHGGQRLLFFKSPNTYVGQYSVSTPPALAFRIEGKAVLLNVPESSGNKVELTAKGPPEKAFLNEEVVTLNK